MTRVVTPGTVVDPSMLDAARNNYIVGVAIDGSRVGLAAADISTGEFTATEIMAGTPEEALLAAGRELLRLGPAEIVRPPARSTTLAVASSAWLPDGVSEQNRSLALAPRTAPANLLRHFQVESLDGFGCAGQAARHSRRRRPFQYLADTQLSGLQQITGLSTYAVDGFMTLDAQTRRNLELSESSRGEKRHSLIPVLDQTRTPMGARLLRRWIGQPLLDLDALHSPGGRRPLSWRCAERGRRSEARSGRSAISNGSSTAA